MKNILGRLTAISFIVTLSAACSDGSSNEDNDPPNSGDGDASEESVEIISWWKGPGEAEALRALLDVHEERNPGSSIFNAAASDGTDAQELIEKRFAKGNPPDVFQENVRDIPLLLEENPGSLASLNKLFRDHEWKDVISPEVLDLIKVDGTIHAMPVGIHRENGLFFNRKILNEHDLDPPKNLEEFWVVCETLNADGITPLATGYQGWILRIMFHSIALGTMGGDGYVDFFTGEGDADDPKLGESIDNFDRILENYISDKMKKEEFGWQEASQALIDGDAAMFFHGDWVGGYVQQLGWEAGVDYGVVASPGASDVFLFGVDTFAVPSDASNLEGAFSFLETIGSIEGQIEFNNVKGSTPVRLDVDKDKLTPVGRATLKDLSDANVLMATPSWENVDDAIFAFAMDHDKDALVSFFQEAIYSN